MRHRDVLPWTRYLGEARCAYFPGPHHDARAIRAEAGEVPLAGFFAQGELGPVGGQNFIHGFTASVVLFED